MTSKTVQKKNYHRYDIDGLKAIAIISVILYHMSDLLKAANIATISWLEGGFLGVDIFLVVSGFLITGSIVNKLNKGEFSLKDFYLHRLARIIPPLIIMVVTVLILGYFLLPEEIYYELNIEAANALIFISNFRFANCGGYFSLNSSDRLLLHTWYLSLTIQFYLVCPLVLLAIKKIFKDRFNLAVLGFFLVLLVTAIVCCRNEKAYLLTQCRIWELFLGATVYCYKDLLKEKLLLNKSFIIKGAELLGIAGIILSILYIRLDVGVYKVHSSALTVISTALVLICNNNQSILKNNIISFIGKISYSLYLWHWPILIFALLCSMFETYLNISKVFAIILFVSFISYCYTEKRKFKVITILTLYILCTASYVYFKNNEGHNYLSAFKIEDYSGKPLEKEYEPSVVLVEHDKEILHLGYQKETPHIFIVGDSNTGHYYYYLKYVRKTPIYFMTIPAAMAFGPEFAAMKHYFFVNNQDRRYFYNLYKKGLDLLKPGDKVILSERWDVQYEPFLGEKKLKRSDESFRIYTEHVVNDLKEQIELHPHLKFYIVGLAMITDKGHLTWTALNLENSFLSKFINTKYYHTSKDFYYKENSYINSKLIEFANKYNNVEFIDRNVPIDIGNELYSIIDNGLPVFKDGIHYTNSGGCLIGKYIMDIVENDK
ncbi:MAG: acyltransferase family protein [Succinivibrio sp.]